MQSEQAPVPRSSRVSSHSSPASRPVVRPSFPPSSSPPPPSPKEALNGPRHRHPRPPIRHCHRSPDRDGGSHCHTAALHHFMRMRAPRPPPTPPLPSLKAVIHLRNATQATCFQWFRVHMTHDFVFVTQLHGTLPPPTSLCVNENPGVAAQEVRGPLGPIPLVARVVRRL